MRLADLKVLIDRACDLFPGSTQIVFTDYTRRRLPTLDFVGQEYDVLLHDLVGHDGRVYLPLELSTTQERSND
jgi:hypothetical protein